MRLILVMVVACSGATAPPANVPARPPQPAAGPPSTFAKLFARGARWTFTTSITTHEPVPGMENMKETKTTGTLTCDVTYSGALAQRWESTVTCTATPGLPMAFPMDFVATPAGLWRANRDEPDAVPSPAARLIEHPPVARSSYDVHEQAEGSISTSVSNKGSRWCFGESQAMQGQTGGWSLCVRDGDLVGGTSERGDGMTMVGMRWGDVDD